MAKFHLYGQDGNYKLFHEEEVEKALESGLWFKSKKEALESLSGEVEESESNNKVVTLSDFSDDEILEEATKRGLIEAEEIELSEGIELIKTLSVEEIKEKYTVVELKEIAKVLGVSIKGNAKEDTIVSKILEEVNKDEE